MGLSLQSAQVGGECCISMPECEPAELFEEELVLPWSSIKHTLKGVAAATKAYDGEQESTVQAIMATVSDEHGAVLSPSADSNLSNVDLSLCLRHWYQIIASTSLEADAQYRAKLALALAFMSLSGRQDYIGFFAIPLWAVLKDGNIDELFRLHVWLADGKRGNPDLAIHPHQAFAQSWILTGKGRDSTFDAEDADLSVATHAEYALAWTDSNGNESGKTYQVHQKLSTAVNTGKLVRVTPRASQVHSRNATYNIPAGVLHTSKVDPDILHATLFFFDASRGFQPYAPILGPINGPPHVQRRDPAGITASALVQMVESVRTWELLYNQGIEYTQRGEWTEALRAFRSSLQVYSADEDLFQAPRYKRLVLREVESVRRVIERDESAATTTEEALYDAPLSQWQVNVGVEHEASEQFTS